MGTLGDKSYNYNFYGLPDPDRVWGVAGYGGYAALTYLNIWGEYLLSAFYTDGIYWEHDGTRSDNYGKPLDDSIALWRIPNKASFASNAIFSAEQGSTLRVHYDVNTHNTNAPLAMCAVDTHAGAYGNFVRSPLERWAYDKSTSANGCYSAPIYDITLNCLCLQVNANIFDQAAPSTAPQGRALAQVADYVDAAPETRDVCVIRPYMYRGTPSSRIRSADYIPPQGQHTTYQGLPLIDTLTNRPIPQTETYLRQKLKDGHDEWRDDVVFSPFSMQLGINLFSTSSTPQIYDSTSQLEIGFTRPFTVNNLKNGAALIEDSHRITAQYYRCNYEPKYFDDVDYQWENVIFDVANAIEIQNGFNLDLLSNTNIRFYTRLRILDAKGNSKGKALELAIKHEMAFIGMYFCDTVARAESSSLGSGDGVGVYLPEIIGGVTTGNYFTGEDIRSVPYANSQSVSDPVFHYDPSSSEEDSGEFKSIIHSGRVEAGTRYYAMTQAQADSIITYLNTTYQPDTIEQLTVDFKGSNPFDYFTIFKYYPFDIPVLSGAGAEVNIGPLDLGWKAPVLEYGYGIPGINYLNMGSVYLDAKYRDFRDYQDTSIIVMLPWCGLVSLDPKIWLEHTLTVRYAIDFVTGTVTAYLLKDDLIWDTANGKLGVDIPLSALANGTYQNEITNALYQLKQAENSRMWAGLGLAGGLIGTAISAATGNLVGAAGGIGAAIASVNKLNQIGEQIDNLEYRIDHTQPRMGVISSASPLNSCVEDQRVKVYMIRHMMLSGYDAAAYGKTIGFSCAKSGKLGSFKGFTKCAAIDLSGVPCSEAEKNMIKNICTKGVRV